jgi:hypothetical protein
MKFGDSSYKSGSVWIRNPKVWLYFSLSLSLSSPINPLFFSWYSLPMFLSQNIGSLMQFRTSITNVNAIRGVFCTGVSPVTSGILWLPVPLTRMKGSFVTHEWEELLLQRTRHVLSRLVPSFLDTEGSQERKVKMKVKEEEAALALLNTWFIIQDWLQNTISCDGRKEKERERERERRTPFKRLLVYWTFPDLVPGFALELFFTSPQVCMSCRLLFPESISSSFWSFFFLFLLFHLFFATCFIGSERVRDYQ